MLILTPEEVNKLVQDFCFDEMLNKNEVCCHLTDLPQGCSELNKCPLFLFKLHLMEKAKRDPRPKKKDFPKIVKFIEYFLTKYADG